MERFFYLFFLSQCFVGLRQHCFYKISSKQKYDDHLSFRQLNVAYNKLVRADINDSCTGTTGQFLYSDRKIFNYRCNNKMIEVHFLANNRFYRSFTKKSLQLTYQ